MKGSLAAECGWLLSHPQPATTLMGRKTLDGRDGGGYFTAILKTLSSSCRIAGICGLERRECRGRTGRWGFTGDPSDSVILA